MSYIRSSSNPEGLYIWCDIKGSVHLSHIIKSPLSSAAVLPHEFTIPRYIFEHILKKYDGQSEVKFRGLKVEERVVNLETGQIYDGAFPKVKGTYQFMIRLSYKNEFIIMWPVTWDYIVSHFKNKQ